MIRIGVFRETASGERRVAVTPDAIPRIRELGLSVVVETGAGAAARYADSQYLEAGAQVAAADEITATADIVVAVGAPYADRLRRGQTVIGLLAPAAHADLMVAYALLGVTALSLDRLPRQLSRAQSMDVLTSQAGIAGYKAAIVAADAYGRYLPMLMTAAGTIRPASVLVLGAGVAGLAAIATARRLGAVVTGYDIRPEAADEIRSLGARYLDVTDELPQGRGAGGYARVLDHTERAAQQLALQERIGAFDIVITTAQVPGRPAPVLVTAEAIKAMRPGSVVVDLAAGPGGGNVEGSRPDETIVLADGVTVIGAGNLPSAMAPGASAAYARNVTALLAHIVHEGQIIVDAEDEIIRAITVVRDGSIVTPEGAQP
jgi:NAD(P) transhydrogenase subunit alpha